MVCPPIGGRKTSRSVRVTSSGYIPPVSSKSVRRSSASVQPKRCATPGSHHTGSTAALVTTAEPLLQSTSPSGLSRPAAIAAWTSGMLICALVTAMVGRMSMPAVIASPKTSATIAPKGSRETIRPASDHCGYGPIRSVGVVSVRSARCRGSSAPDATASAR